MREIRFRAWHDKDKVWHYFDWANLTSGKADSLWYTKWGQYTGQLDKHGKEIYEGDKFKVGNIKDILIMEFVSGSFGYFFYTEFVSISKTWSNIKDKIEIIGNIYDDEEG